METVTFKCPGCSQHLTVSALEAEQLSCPGCQTQIPFNKKNLFEICPLCECRQFYIQKDFNQAVGCLIMLVGIGLVPKTYGLSLPVVCLFDWLLYRKVATIVLCYRCGAEYRGFPIPPQFKTFRHPIGVKYDKQAEKKEIISREHNWQRKIAIVE